VNAPRVALVHDWLDTWRGGENVLAELLRIYPQADLFALVDFLPDALRARLLGRHAVTSFLQRLPGARRHFRAFLPLFPSAIESLDVSAYDLVVSCSHAVAKGVRTRADQLHICYCHTPMRYAWDLRDQYLEVSGHAARPWAPAVRHMLDRLREWDRRTSDRVNAFVANSEFIRARIRRCYGRDATVIAPPVDTDFFTPGSDRRDGFVTASRWVPYKRVDVIVAAFRELPAERLVVVGDGPEAARVRAAAGPNVVFAGEVSRERLRELLRGARAFLFAAEEDFGILPVEAQSVGTPVIAYGRGGVLETVRGLDDPAPTGVFFAEQTPAAVASAVCSFAAAASRFGPETCRANAECFSAQRFRRDFAAFVAARRAEFAAAGAPP
jgi:glycosyltransferase involved in cell wall biosynthesis